MMHSGWRDRYVFPSSTGHPRQHTRLAGAALLCALQPAAVLAQEREPLTPQNLWSVWHWSPSLLLYLALAAWFYACGARTLWRRAGWGRGLRYWQAAAFAGGLATVFVALVSPLDALGAILFSVHMAQHLVLILIAAPLLVLGTPLVPLLWSLPPRARRSLSDCWRVATPLRVVWRALTLPPIAWLLHAALVWIWHLPGPYQAALRNNFVHAVEHGSFLGTALLFWWTIMHPHARGRLGYGVSVFAIFLMMVQGGILGALIAFAPTPWYQIHAERLAAWNLTPLEDQQLAGLIMWVPASLIYGLTAAGLFITWLNALDRAVRQRELLLESRMLPE